MYQEKRRPREDYRRSERQRVNESVSLSEKYRNLKSLTVEFGYYNPEGSSQNRQIKYAVNADHAKSVFLLDCVNSECVCGDFDLSETLNQAVATQQASVTGEMRCPGWLSKTTIDRIRCRNILRYKLLLEYGIREP